MEDGNCNIKYKDGSEYEGEIVNGKRHGRGRMEYNNKAVYNGLWDNDQRYGLGCLVYKADFFFEGFFAGDYTDGPGVLVRKDTFNPDSQKRSVTPVSIFSHPGGSIEKSEFFDNLADYPIFRTLPLESFDLVFITQTPDQLKKHVKKPMPPGKFVSGKLTGGGIIKYGNFGFYFGSFLEGKRSGYGKMIYTDPDHLCEWFPETEGEYVGE